jgi:peptidoglycan/LPS O-acetylase OafA/YrhL
MEAMTTAVLKTQNPEPRLPGGPDWLWRGRVPSLDGLRAVAIVIVIANHAKAGPLGDLGVGLFFVISGFLITLLLIRERKRHGRISLKQFYFRRAVRILPAFLTFMAFLGLLQLLGVLTTNRVNWILSLTFTLNILPIPERQWHVGHIWSLCVEEHFYLLWPPIVAVLGSIWSYRAAWLCVLTAPIWRWVFGIQFVGIFTPQYFTLTRMDSIAMGCCLAIALTRDRTGSLCKFSRAWVIATWITIVVLVIVALKRFFPGRVEESHLKLLFGNTLLNIAFTLLLWISVCVPNGWVGRVLNAKPMVWIGILSYSLYLWQQPFLNPDCSRWMCVWPNNVIIAVSLATCSYLAVERPLLRWRQRQGSVAR